jgi:DNA-directed RNA polymerase III subunit RPC3
VLLAHFYKTLYNLSIRRRAEEEEPGIAAIIEKRERSGIGQDESALTRIEQEILRDWEKRRERLTVLEQRIEEAVFILRDFGNAARDDD